MKYRNFCYYNGLQHDLKRFTANVSHDLVITIWKCLTCGSYSSARIRKLKVMKNTKCCIACCQTMHMFKKHQCIKLDRMIQVISSTTVQT